MRERAPRPHDELRRVVEAGGIAPAPFQQGRPPAALAPSGGPDRGLSRLHPGSIPSDRVDLAVVREQPERLRQGPGRGGVRAVALVEEREGGLVERVCEIGVEVRQVRAAHERLVDEGARRQRHDREALGREALEPPFHLTASEEEAGLERLLREAAGTPDEQVQEPRAASPRLLSERLLADRRLSPGEQRQAARREHALDRCDTGPALLPSSGKQDEARGETARPRQPEALLGELPREQRVRNLGRHARPVPGAAVGIHGAAVRHARQGRERERQHAAARVAAAVRNEPDAARVASASRVRQTGPARLSPSSAHAVPPFARTA